MFTTTPMLAAAMAAPKTDGIANDGGTPKIITSVSEKERSSLRFTRSPARLGKIAELKQPLGEPIHYGLISFMQISSNEVAAIVNRNLWPRSENWDCEDGCDVFVVGTIDQLGTTIPVPVGRSGIFPDPANNGVPRWHNRYPVRGGFFPLGANRDNRSHPHAGTGFLIGSVYTYPIAEDGSWKQSGGDVSVQLEMYRTSYDGRTFTAEPIARYTDDHPLVLGSSGWNFRAGGLCDALQDGDGFLWPVSAMRAKDGVRAVGLSHWERRDGQWIPTDFSPVALTDNAGDETTATGIRFEPSVVRDARGRLVFCARDEMRRDLKDPAKFDVLQDINAWLSEDDGKTWRQILNLPRHRSWAPVTVGQTADGKVYICTSPVVDGGGWYTQRRRLAIWQFNDNYTEISSELIVRDTEEFAPAAVPLLADHPITSVVRLADGRLHTILSYRVRLQCQFDRQGNPLDPGRDDGAYAEEVIPCTP